MRYFRLLITVALLASCPLRADWLAQQTSAFAESDIRFQRGDTLVPMIPLAYLQARYYGDTHLEREDGTDLPVSQTTLSQGAGLPFMIGKRDALVVGEWISRSEFRPSEPSLDDFSVTSFALPVGWLRQASPDWQWAAFAMPLGHKTSLPGADWSWEVMGGAFARKVESDRFWWVAGVYMDLAPGDDLYLPYLGGSWALDQHWTLSAVLPWPALLYAPSENLLWRLGAAPSGTSWQLNPDGQRLSVDLSGIDLGLSVERRLWGNVWVGAEVGLGGFRGLSFGSEGWQGWESDTDSDPYLSLEINYRPELRD